MTYALPPVPALPDTPRLTTYTGVSASVGPFSVGFALYGDGTDAFNWIGVYVNEVELAPGAWTLTSPTGQIGLIPLPIVDGQITLAAPATGTVIILGARRPRRLIQLQEGRGVPARDQNVEFSDVTAMMREVWDRLDRVPAAPPGETMIPLPPRAARAMLPASFDSNGNLIAAAGQVPVGIISTAMAPVVAAATLADAEALLTGSAVWSGGNPVDPTGYIDSTAGIQATADWARANATTVEIPDGVYKISKGLVFTPYTDPADAQRSYLPIKFGSAATFRASSAFGRAIVSVTNVSAYVVRVVTSTPHPYVHAQEVEISGLLDSGGVNYSPLNGEIGYVNVIDSVTFTMDIPTANTGWAYSANSGRVSEYMLTLGSLGTSSTDYSGLIRRCEFHCGIIDCNGYANGGVNVPFTNGLILRGNVWRWNTKAIMVGSPDTPSGAGSWIFHEDTNLFSYTTAPFYKKGIFHNNCNDSHFENCMITGAYTGISGGYDGKYQNCHVWNYGDPLAIAYLGIGRNSYNACEADGSQYGFVFQGRGNLVVGCTGYLRSAGIAAPAYPIYHQAGGQSVAIGNTWAGGVASPTYAAECGGLAADVANFISIGNTFDGYTPATAAYPAIAPYLPSTFVTAYVGSNTLHNPGNVASIAWGTAGGVANAQCDITLINPVAIAAQVHVTPMIAGLPFIIANEFVTSRTTSFVRLIFQDSAGNYAAPAGFYMHMLGVN